MAMTPEEKRKASAQRSREWRARNPERRKVIAALSLAKAMSKPGWRKAEWDRTLRKQYGINGATYDRMMQEQDGKCYLCGQPETMTQNGRVVQLCVDHNHKTGQVRRLLCHACNFLVGRVETSPALHEKAMAYIRQFEA